MMKVSIINTNIGNIQSLKNMFNRIGIETTVCFEKSQLEESNVLVLPGVGSFDAAINYLKGQGIYELLSDKNFLKKKYLIGICLGMQILLENSEEGNEKGLCLIPGKVKKFEKNIIKVPHMGWNILNECKESFSSLKNMKFYFAHSYFVECKEEYIQATCVHDHEFPAIIRSEKIIGIQFHPEKSHQNGILLLKNLFNKISLNAL
tara:strand:+ start:4503 stop:5117 length:615 start_codon:yes stop_codon:yes gene_type:complete